MTRLSLEPLDRRDMPSVTLSNGALSVIGTDHRDVADVSVVGDQIRVRLTAYPSGGGFGTGATYYVPAASVTEGVHFHGLAGDDSFTNGTNLYCVALGGDGDDTLRGGGGRNFLYGGSGDDLLYGGGLNDYLYGNDGNDRVFAGGGNDTVYGGNGDDMLKGEDGDDRLYGGHGADTMFGMFGDDFLDGGADGHADYLHGGSGADQFRHEAHWINPFVMINLDFPKDAGPDDQILL